MVDLEGDAGECCGEAAVFAAIARAPRDHQRTGIEVGLMVRNPVLDADIWLRFGGL